MPNPDGTPTPEEIVAHLVATAQQPGSGLMNAALNPDTIAMPIIGPDIRSGVTTAPALYKGMGAGAYLGPNPAQSPAGTSGPPEAFDPGTRMAPGFAEAHPFIQGLINAVANTPIEIHSGRGTLGTGPIALALLGLAARAQAGPSMQNQAFNSRASQAARDLATHRWQASKSALELSQANVRVAKEQDRLNSIATAVAGGKKATGQGNVDPEDIQSVAEMMASRQLPPTFLDGRPTQYTMRVIGAIRKIDPKFELTRSRLDYLAAIQGYRTLNQQNSVNLRRAINKASTAVDLAKQYNQDLTAALAPLPRTTITKVNQLGLAWVLNGGAGVEAQKAAQNLRSQLEILRTELPTVYSGGYAPQAENYKHSVDIVGTDSWGPDRIIAGLGTAQRDLNLANNAIYEAGIVSPSNPAPPIGTPQTNFNVGSNPMPLAVPPDVISGKGKAGVPDTGTPTKRSPPPGPGYIRVRLKNGSEGWMPPGSVVPEGAIVLQ